MKICPKCMTQLSDNETYCPKCGVDLEQMPEKPMVDTFGLGISSLQMPGMQMSFPPSWNQALATQVMPRPMMPAVSPIQMVADLVTRVHAQTGIKTIAVFCPHCKSFDDFYIMPLKKGENILTCKKDENKAFGVKIGWFEEVSVFIIK